MKMQVRKHWERGWYAWCPKCGTRLGRVHIDGANTQQNALKVAELHLEQKHDVVLTGR